VTYWLAAAAFALIGIFALARPDAILRIRARFPRLGNSDPRNERRRSSFGAREVRICGLVLVIIGVALARTVPT
jgi:hypothetical protein